MAELRRKQFDRDLRELQASLDAVSTICTHIQVSIDEILDGALVMNIEECKAYLAVLMQVLSDANMTAKNYWADVREFSEKEPVKLEPACKSADAVDLQREPATGFGECDKAPEGEIPEKPRCEK